MDEQQKVASFIEEHEMGTPPAYRLLDLVSELGEVAKDAAESADYGEAPAELDIKSDEIDDVLFSLLALADAVEVEADEALDEALAKYADRVAEADTASSGN
jgi:NTP pyrophosphatase (non-canonical NTP hydrolase)